MKPNVYSYSCRSINGEEIALQRFRGKAMLIVNTASYCGFTPQFKGLEYLYRRYQERGFVVLGFPCNQFANQEPYDSERISDFCIRNYAVSFPMFAKIKVNGPDADPLFQFLKAQAPGLFGSQSIKWNFTKFLVGREGDVIGRYGTTTFPRRLAKQIERLLR
ncbi:MAG: glutathione peroxidase [Spongiibacteraceae bacterium]